MTQKLVILFLVTWFAFQPHTDLDLGWHLKYGEYFFRTGQVLKENIFSFVWPNYQWVQASWGYDLIVYQIFTRAGFWGLSIAASLTTVAIFLMLTAPIRRFSLWQFLFLAVLFLTQTAALYGGGIRSQTPSSLLFALVIILAWRNFYAPLPFIFLVWANLHGGFALGLMLLWLMWAASGLAKTLSRKTWLLFGLSLALSTLTPLVNPWGLRIYEETFKHGINVNLTAISEWMPLWKWPVEAVVTGTISGSVAVLAIYRKSRRDIPLLVVLLAATYLAFNALRFTIIFGIIATYYWAQSLSEIRISNRIIKKNLKFLKAGLLLLIFFDIFYSKYYLAPVNIVRFPATWDAICERTHDCSVKVANIMNTDPPIGNGFHPYNWGGFLIWNVPDVKTFLDGRMAAWEQDGKTPPVIEGDWISTTPTPLIFKRFEAEYHFRWVVIPSDSKLGAYLDELVKQNLWELRYKDQWDAYYVKKNA